MGTTWSASFVSRDVTIDSASRVIQSALDGVVAEMSPWESWSDISRYNLAAAGTWVDLPPGLITVLKAALEIAADSSGAYDPASGALVDLWGFGPASTRAAPPDAAEIENARAFDWRALRIDGSCLYQPGALKLDFSSIAKGYGVDAAGEALTALGIESWLVEIGGELKGRGTKPDGAPWWISLEPRTLAPLTVALSGLAVATSGDAVRYFEYDGRKYSHTVDPRTGHPVAHDLCAVTVLHESAMFADAYATAALVLGPEEGLAFAEARRLAARFVIRDPGALREVLTPSLQAMLD